MTLLQDSDDQTQDKKLKRAPSEEEKEEPEAETKFGSPGKYADTPRGDDPEAPIIKAREYILYHFREKVPTHEVEVVRENTA